MDVDIKLAIDALALVTPNASAIARHLQRTEAFAARAPSERGVQNYLRRRRSDSSGAWTLGAPEATAAVDAYSTIEVLGWLLSATDRRASGITQREAQWITLIRDAVPDVPPDWALLLARSYISVELSEGEPGQLPIRLARLDGLLAVRPWEDERLEVLRSSFMRELEGQTVSRVPDEALRGAHKSRT